MNGETMGGILVFLIALFTMIGWFIYLFIKDPANLFKRGRRNREEPPNQ